MNQPKFFKGWILYFLVANIGGMVLGGIVGFFLGVVMGLAKVELNTIKIVCGFAGFLISIPVSYFTFRWVVTDFVLKSLVPQAPAAESPPQLNQSAAR